MICEHCGQVERVENAPCPNCKFQPEGEWDDYALQTGTAPHDRSVEKPTAICPECGTARAADPLDPCERCKELDVCPTPPELALAICNRIEQTACRNHYMREPFRILEPSAGDGAFVLAARQVWPTSEITAVEIRAQCHSKIVAAGVDHTITDLLEGVFTSSAAELGNIDLCIGNPPFSIAEDHIRLLLGSLRPGAVLAFLLRTGFYESHTRIPFWREFPEDSFAPIVPRPGFKLNAKGKKGTDSQSYGLFIWTKRNHHDGESVLDGRALPIRDAHIVWRDPSPRGRKKRDEVKSSSSPEPAPEPEVFDLE